MKKLILFFVLSASALFAQTNSATDGANAASRGTVIDGYAARVDSHIITYGDIRARIEPLIQQAAQQFGPRELELQIQAMFKDGREALIGEALIVEEIKRNGFQLPDHVVDDEIQTITRNNFEGSRAKLIKALMTRRMTFDEWRTEIGQQLTMRIYYNQEVLQKVAVSDEDVRDEYERVKAGLRIPFRVKYRYILINKGATEEEQAVKRQQAEGTLKKLQAGADFSVVAKAVSEGNSDISPWRDPEDVKEEMRPALYSTAAGQISDLIEGEKVFYIIRVESRQEEGYEPFKNVSEQIRASLTEKERQRLHGEMVDRLSAKHYVERF
jgi:parvulin-like peptidyl-prolyl isomerase